MLPIWPLFLTSMSPFSWAPPANVTEGTQIAKDGQGKVIVNTITCVNGKCTHNNKTGDAGGAGLFDPKVPGSIIQRMLASMSNIAKHLEEEMEQAGPDLPGIIDGMSHSPPSSDDQIGNSTRPDMFPMPLSTNITGFDPFKNMKNILGMPGFEDPMDDPWFPMRNLTGVDPFKDMKDIFGMPPGFGDVIHDPLLPIRNSSGTNPLDDILHRVLGGMFGDDSSPIQGIPDQGNGDRTYTRTKIENGHAMQETTTCRAGKCTTEKHEFDVPSMGGQPIPNSSPEVPLF